MAGVTDREQWEKLVCLRPGAETSWRLAKIVGKKILSEGPSLLCNLTEASTLMRPGECSLWALTIIV